MARIKSTPRECWLLLGIYLASRLVNLRLLPVFNDEAIHIRAAQDLILTRDPFHPFQTISPKFALDWLTASFVSLPLDPLISARMASVFAGTLSLVGVYLIARTIYSGRIAAIAAALYVLIPLALFHERMLLADVLLNTCATYSLLFSLQVMRKGNAWSAVGLGMALGFGMLSKLTGVFLVLTPLLVWAFATRSGLGVLTKRLAPAYLIAGLVVSPVLLHPSRVKAFVEIDRKTILASQGLSQSDWIGQVLTNTATALRGVSAYVTTPLMVALGISLGMVLVLRNREGAMLWAQGLLPALAMIGTSGGWLPPRYFLVTVGPLMISAAWTIERLAEALACRARGLAGTSTILFSWRLTQLRLCVCVPVLVALSFPAVRFDYYILSRPSDAPLPAKDRFQYIGGWPAGYGVPEVVQYLRQQVNREHVRVITHWRSGIPLDALYMYFNGNERITIVPQNLDGPVGPSTCREGGLVVVNTPQDIGPSSLNPAIELLAKYHKPGGSSVIELYRCR
jgi:hypothetical protein